MPCASTPRCAATGWSDVDERLEGLRDDLAERERTLARLRAEHPADDAESG